MEDNADVRRFFTGAVVVVLLLGGPGIIGALGLPWPVTMAAIIAMAWLVFGDHPTEPGPTASRE